MFTTDSFPQGHRPCLHTTFNCILSKTFARSTTKAVAPINCVSFHRKHRFPSRSLSTTNVRNSSIQVTLCLLFRTTTAGRTPVPPWCQSFHLCFSLHRAVQEGWRGPRSPHMAAAAQHGERRPGPPRATLAVRNPLALVSGLWPLGPTFSAPT